jgi:hypothetical protein
MPNAQFVATLNVDSSFHYPRLGRLMFIQIDYFPQLRLVRALPKAFSVAQKKKTLHTIKTW